MVRIDGDCRSFHKTLQQFFKFVAMRVGKRQKTIPFQWRGHSRSSVELSVREPGNNKTNRSYKSYRTLFAQATIPRISASTCLRPFKRFAASCYSGVPCFRPKPGPDSQNPARYGF